MKSPLTRGTITTKSWEPRLCCSHKWRILHVFWNKSHAIIAAKIGIELFIIPAWYWASMKLNGIDNSNPSRTALSKGSLCQHKIPSLNLVTCGQSSSRRAKHFHVFQEGHACTKTGMIVVGVFEQHAATFQQVYAAAVMVVDCVPGSRKLDDSGGELVSQIMG